MTESTMPSHVVTLSKFVCRLFFVVFFLVLMSPAAKGNDTQKLYNDKCAGCHTIGGGNLVGPDLSSSAKWSDVDLTKAVKKMEENVGPLSDDEVSQLVQYIKTSKAVDPTKRGEAPPSAKTSASGKEPGSADTVALSQTLASKELGSAEVGAKLFDGRSPFKNGGVSCIACHQAEGIGGSLGPDLTNVSSKMNEAALASACEHTAFKIMKPTYKDHKISRQEALDLTQYLKVINERKIAQRELPVVLYGLGTAVVVIALIALGYGRRNKSIRKRLKGD